MNKKPYLNHTSVIIINEDLAKNKFNETINYLLHDVRIRSACYFIISKNQIIEIESDKILEYIKK